MLPFIAAGDPFPDPSTAWCDGSEAPGLLCAGGDLSVASLLNAYRQGIFPWFSEGQPPLWWSTNPRMVLHPAEFKLHRSLKKNILAMLRSGCEVRIDHDPARVIAACANSTQRAQAGTWIVQPMQAAYTAFARAGHVHSVEVWQRNTLVGGLYLVAIGGAVFGESMFHTASNASKLALAALVALCRAQGVTRIDCQQQTSHLASLGARPIARAEFLAQLQADTRKPALEWTWQPLYWNEIHIKFQP